MSRHMAAAADNLILELRKWRLDPTFGFLRSRDRKLAAAIDRWETAYAIELDRGPEKAPADCLHTQP